VRITGSAAWGQDSISCRLGFAREADQAAVVHHAHGRRGHVGGQKRHLADALARRHLADPAHAAAAVLDEHPQPPLHQEVERRARLALADQGLAGTPATLAAD